MRMWSLLLVILTVLALLLSSTARAANDDDEVTAEVNPLYYRCREDGGRYAANSTYLSNLKALYEALVANASTSNFVSGAVGQPPDAAYGFVLCRGDYSGAACADSLRRAFQNAVDKGFVCRLYRDVTVYYDQHMLRFSGDDVRRLDVDNRPAWVAWNMNSVAGAAGKSYGEKVRKLADMIVDAAANSTERYGTGKAGLGDKEYHLGKREIILITIAAVLAFIILICILRWIIQQKIESKARNELEEWTRLITVEIGTIFSHFTLSEIRNATNNCSEAKKLGEGAFGPVYRGQLTCGVAAIKRLAAYSSQGFEEFRNEIRLIANLQHLHLVKLIGCCMQNEEKILVYEYMPNRSLDDVFKDVAKWASLTWHIRRNIIDGIAQGLLYIHNYSHPETCIVHRDLKASNILLDGQMNPKISDFGIARMFSSRAAESQATIPMGTPGYMAPECFSGNTISVKSDVFSFGVSVLEIISGRKVATSFRRYKRSDNLMTYTETANPDDRPDMKEIVRMLSNKGTQLDNPKQPSYFNEPIVAVELATTRNRTHTRYHTAVHVHPVQ
ncbi:hypothetical protein ACP70R_046563 [Stipagrostis hirtigluma subsp. patula]